MELDLKQREYQDEIEKISKEKAEEKNVKEME